MVKDEDALRASLLLQQLLHFLVVHRLDPLVVEEILLRADVLDELETSFVEGDGVLLSTNVENDCGMWPEGSPGRGSGSLPVNLLIIMTQLLLDDKLFIVEKQRTKRTSQQV